MNSCGLSACTQCPAPEMCWICALGNKRLISGYSLILKQENPKFEKVPQRPAQKQSIKAGDLILTHKTDSTDSNLQDVTTC